MDTWTVLGSSNFDDSRAHYTAIFKAKLAQHRKLADADAAGQLYEWCNGFRRFREILKRFEAQQDGSLLPGDELAYIQNGSDGVPIYSLIYENWRCLYRVDNDDLTCIAIKMEEMSKTLRFVEEDRHGMHGRLLRSAESRK